MGLRNARISAAPITRLPPPPRAPRVPTLEFGSPSRSGRPQTPRSSRRQPSPRLRWHQSAPSTKRPAPRCSLAAPDEPDPCDRERARKPVGDGTSGAVQKSIFQDPWAWPRRRGGGRGGTPRRHECTGDTDQLAHCTRARNGIITSMSREKGPCSRTSTLPEGADSSYSGWASACDGRGVERFSMQRKHKPLWRSLGRGGNSGFNVW